MTIHAVLDLEVTNLPEEEDYPHQQDEYRMQLLERELVSFISRFCDDNTKSEEEDRSLRFGVAMKLLESFQSRIQSELLRARLMERRPSFPEWVQAEQGNA